MPRSRLFGAAALLPLAALAGPPQLVRDINTQPEAASSVPADLQDQGSWFFFTAFDGVARTPWATDGTAAGTVRLANIALPSPPAWLAPRPPNPAVRAGNLTYFSPQGVLWVTDGTPAGTRKVRDLADVTPVAAVNGVLIFMLGQVPDSRELWRTDGSDVGTYRLTTINPGFPHESLKHAVVGNRLFFLSMPPPEGVTEVWVSDGTTAAALPAIPQAVGEQYGISNLVVLGDNVLFAATTSDFGRELWRIDTANNDAIERVTDIAPGDLDGVAFAKIDTVGGVAVFTGMPDGVTGALWRSDGTPAGTAQVNAVLPLEEPPAEAFIGPTTSGRLLFRVFDGTRAELWSTNGAAATRLLAGADFTEVGLVGARYYYAVSTSTEVQLWRTDGTVVGTKRLTGLPGSQFAAFAVAGDMTSLYARVVHGSSTSEETAVRVVKYDLTTDGATDLLVYAGVVEDELDPQAFGFARGMLLFDARSGVGRELWISDGTHAGTRLLKNVAPETGNASSAPGAFVAYGNRLYFAADDGVSGRELWRSDATSVGTALVQDLHPGPGSSEPQDAFVVGSRLLFFARNGIGHESYRLWATDGTASGAQPLSPPLVPPTLAQRSQYLTSQLPCGPVAVHIGPYAYFRAYGGLAWELWRSDGTPGGTERVAEFGSPPCWLAVLDGRVYFGAAGADGRGIELWRYDPAVGDASLVADVWPGAQGSVPSELTVLNGRLLFHAYTAANAAQLWQSDGSSTGTSRLSPAAGFSAIRSLTRAGPRVVFRAFDELWASDGTVAGTGPVGIPSGFGGTYGFGAALSIPSGALILSRGVSQSRLEAPWITDGTLVGSQLLSDLSAAALPEPVVFVDFNGVGVFTASDGNEHRLWRTDGTPAGTTLVGGNDLMLVVEPPAPTRLAAGQNFFYVSTEGNVGMELFAFGNDAPLAFNDAATADSAAAVAIAVLANDRDADGALEASSVRVFSSPANGTAVAQASGTIIYTSNAGFSGTDTFSYTVADRQRAVSQVATVQVTVAAAPTVTPPTVTPPAVTPPAPVPPATGGGGGGGGATEWTALLLLLAALAQRRRRRVRR